MAWCLDCGGSFYAKGTWQKRCTSCFKALKETEAKEEKRAAYLAGFQAGQDNSKVSLDPELLKALIALCHPDRHPVERHEQATRATQELLALRER